MEFIKEGWAVFEAAFGPIAPFVAMGLVGFVLIMVAAFVYINRRPDPLDKLRQSQNQSARAAKAKKGPEVQRLRQEEKNKIKLDKFANFLEPQDQQSFSAARLKLIQAGYRSRSAVRAFHAMQFVGGIGGLILGLAYALLTADGEVSQQSLIISVLVPGGAGYYMPTYWVERRRQTRNEEILNGFPDALDLMLVCVEAGQSLDQAIIRVSKEIRAGYPALADEFEMVALEIKAGKDKTNVLKDMAERCGVPDISSFVTVLIQSATFGTSIAEALRVFSSEMRDKRVMRAEEKANVLPTKLTLGTMLFTLPPLLIILIGPSIYNIATMLGGGGP